MVRLSAETRAIWTEVFVIFLSFSRKFLWEYLNCSKTDTFQIISNSSSMLKASLNKLPNITFALVSFFRKIKDDYVFYKLMLAVQLTWFYSPTYRSKSEAFLREGTNLRSTYTFKRCVWRNLQGVESTLHSVSLVSSAPISVCLRASRLSGQNDILSSRCRIHCSGETNCRSDSEEITWAVP
jgi:hypothetical protein